MAVNASAYSPKQFSFLIAEQDDYGTLNPDSGGSPDNSWVAVDVDSIGSPSLNLNQVLEHRTGGRVLQASDFFQDNKAKVMEMFGKNENLSSMPGINNKYNESGKSLFEETREGKSKYVRLIKEHRKREADK